MNLILRFIIGLISIAFASCGSSVVKNREGSFLKFPAEIQLAESDYLNISQLHPDGMMLYDSILFIRNFTKNDPSAKFHFSLLNLNTRSFMPGLLQYGRKYGQVMSFLSYGASDGYLWSYDIIKDKLILAKLDSALSGQPGGVSEVRIPTFYYSIQLLNDTEIIASGDYESNYKVYQIDLTTGKIKKQMAPYAADTAMKFPAVKKMAYESFLFLKPSKDKCALACRYADQVEIIDMGTQQSKIIKGPENYEPDVAVMEGPGGKEVATRGSDTRYAFVKGKVTNKYIYLLYSGNNHEGEHLFYGKYIYVYDWNGNPVQKIELKSYVLDFAVTADDTQIYTYDPASKHLRVANLKL